MNRNRILVLAGFLAISAVGCESEPPDGKKPLTGQQATSVVTRTDANELVLEQEITISAPVESVWLAYTTEEGWTAWASPKAEIDLRVGGTIRTAYQGDIGGSNTNTLHIINYVPNRLLTLQAELSANWPEIMKEDAEKLSNVVIFDEIGDGVTRIQSFGLGYTDAPEYDQLMGFFIKANENLYQNLRLYLETGARVEWDQ